MELIQLENLLKEENVIHYDYGCLMVELNPPHWNEILDQIDPEDLYDNDKKEYGLEQEPHATILYGFLLDHINKEKLKKEMEHITPIRLELTTISSFDQPEYDVLKFDVESLYLHKLNKYFRKHYEYENEHKDYKPHCTIAYLKKGTAKKYIQKFKGIHPEQFIAHTLIFSGYTNEDQIVVTLKDKSSTKKHMKKID